MACDAARRNAREAQRIYQEMHPHRRLPHHETFSTTYRRLRDTGSVHFQEPRINVREQNLAVDERILQAFEENPNTSIRAVARALNLTIWKVWSVLRAVFCLILLVLQKVILPGKWNSVGF
ncbi:uncharacterized protein LOC126738684 isoform X2 [Anthonomus grandis grandis]|nr:uncharacterized protein LOC126738684 isoform X2 [Anthonomus grandis grandis]XP_050300082.1 uncharacterized protein LOC126738684 isoform X2 [Anthonomus grandis grandis]